MIFFQKSDKKAAKPASDSTTNEPLKKETKEGDDSDLINLSRKRKFKPNDLDDVDETSMKQADSNALNDKLSTVNDDSINKAKKIKLENLDITDMTEFGTHDSTVVRSSSFKIEAVERMKLPNVREKTESRKKKNLRLKQDRKQKKLEEFDNKLEEQMYEYLFQNILLEYLETKAPSLGFCYKIFI